MSNAEGRWDGSEKALRHRELCQFYVAVLRGYDDPECVLAGIDADYIAVHEATQVLTDSLDEAIGFPLTGRPDYDRLESAFFARFHALAMDSLTPGAALRGCPVDETGEEK